MEPSDLALGVIARAARERRGDAIDRWRTAIGSDGDAHRWEGTLTDAGRLTVNFHPDRIAASGLSVAEALAGTGTYVSQWVTGISSGGRSAFDGGDRHAWERRLFGGAYDGADPARVAFPIYGALDLLVEPHGGSPRFGSTYLVLADHVRDRTTFCVGDSHAGPTDLGTGAEPWCILAGLAEQAASGELLDRRLGTDDLRAALAGRWAPTAPARRLDRYVEAQVHGGIDLSTDVVAIVADPSFRDTPVERHLAASSSTFEFELAWHGGSQLRVGDIPDDFRGPTMPSLGRVVAGTGGVVDAQRIGRAAASLAHREMLPSGDPPESDAQQLKFLWHTVLAFGHDVG